MKKNFVLITVIVSTVLLAVFAVMIALKIKQLGTSPVAPSAPGSKPRAVAPTPAIPEITPIVEACQLNFAAVATSTPGPSPTPTITPTPGGPTTTPILTLTPGPSSTPGPFSTPGLSSTPAPTGTITSVPGQPTNTPILGESYCDYLRADKTAGLAPLTVKFFGKGVDSTLIKGFRFTFGDGEKQEILGSFSSSHIREVTHTYPRIGAYTAVLEMLDNGDHFRTRDECRLVISVGVEQTISPTGIPVPGASVTPVLTGVVAEGPAPTEVQLPAAGLKLPTLTGLIVGFLLISLGAALVF